MTASRTTTIQAECKRGDIGRQVLLDVKEAHHRWNPHHLGELLRKRRHAKNASGRADEEIYNLSSLGVDILPPITFSNHDLSGLHFPHDDALIVSAVVTNFNVQRILVNNGSSSDILFISAFDKMKIGMDKLHSFHTPLIADAEIGALRDELEEITLMDPRESENTKPLEEITPKRRKFTLERLKVIEEEVAKLIKANVIRESHYPDWLANIIVTPKKGEKWRVCVDFTDLNKVCPKDSFPLPKIYLIVNVTSKHELLSFMNAFSGYHQIKMYPSDVEKTSFITE
ncbi:hypothetical protein Acr_10g0007330 [Actinidia rufa]|uniref:Reverse transcriptase domain-containing protein n=1 Tax=Actinidia rufa TaxID=165716 RepID=A0A7J0F9G8_9ERIC|nr:hypothetical protein Acr_10g0007330 [Actinidia rufa]